MRLWAIVLSGVLACAGCYTTELANPIGFPRGRQASESPIFLRSADGGTMRLDPNTNVRFVLQTSEVSDWVSGRDLWLSDLGTSYETSEGTFFVSWSEVTGIEVRNLAGAQTFFAILGTTVAILLLLGGGSMSTGGNKPKQPIMHRRLAHEPGRPHVHVPVVVATGAALGPYGAPTVWAPMPAPGPSATNPMPAMPQASSGVEARPLFQGEILRSSQVEIVSHGQGGVDSFRAGTRISASAMLGVRFRETFELEGGVRVLRASDQETSRDLAVIGIGHAGAHLWLDDNHLFALCLSLEGGAGHQVLYHVRTSFGLRFSPIRDLSIGLLPVNPTFVQYKDGAGGPDQHQFTFPTSFEIGFVF